MAIICSLLMNACQESPKEGTTISGLKRSNFQMNVNGKQTDLYTLHNTNGMEVCITNFGARIVSVMVPDRNGQMRDVVLGFDSIGDYVNHETDFGATIGRYANRIGHARFTLDGDTVKLPANNYGHCLHGGPNGFQYRVFTPDSVSDNLISLSYRSVDGEEGFPGNLTCKVTFKLTNDNAIDISYEATTDKNTVVNLTNHSYFNLDGDPTRNNSAYILTIDADSFTPVDSTFMTTGEISPVEGTELDFRTPHAIGERIDLPNEQLRNGKGYDHNWILNTQGDITRTCATVKSPQTGIVLSVSTTEPGMQVYTGNFLDGSINGKKGITYGWRSAICLETQKFPDTPNKPNWPSATLRPGEKYTSRCIYRFTTE